MININDLKNKTNNPEQTEAAQSVAANQKLTADEFVEKVVKPIIELQDEYSSLNGNVVKSIVRNGQALPMENGVVTLPSDDTAVNVLCENSLSTIISVDGTAKVKLAFTSMRGGSNSFEIVDVSISTFNNGSYTKVGSFPETTSNYSSPTYKEYNLAEYGLTNGVYENVLIEATGRTTKVTGSYQFSKITLTKMYLVCNQNYQTPMFAKQLSNAFPVSYKVYGVVDKTLHVVLKNGGVSQTYNYQLSDTDDNKSITKAISDQSFLKHGVTEVVSWLTCSDGRGNDLQSDVLINRFMVVNPDTEGADLTKPYILLQGVSSDNSISVLQNFKNETVNYVQSNICDYALYSPAVDESGNVTNSGPSKNIVFVLTSYATAYQGWNDEYLRIESVVAPGKANKLLTTVEIEDKEGAEASTYFNSYLWVRLVEGSTDVDILSDSQGVSNIGVYVDNTQGFSPTAGADFLLNPKVRNNTETNPKRILNARKNNSLVPAQFDGFGWINDGWIVSDMDGQKVLRIPAGAKLKIGYNPFAQFLTNPDSSMTFELDFAIHNVLDEEAAVLSIIEEIQSAGGISKLGFEMCPLRGDMYNALNMNDNQNPQTSFYYQEDTRTHISVNIHNSVTPKGDDALVPKSGSSGLNETATQVALVRIFVNGIINREMKFNINNYQEFIINDMSVDSDGNVLHGIELGSTGADIDIYSMRCYTNKNISTEQVQQNYMSTLPTAEEKKAFQYDNKLTTGGRIDVEKCKAHGKRCLIWHGVEPYKLDTDSKYGWWEIWNYNADGTYNPDISGTICKETKALQATRQGSTANSYYYSNLQTKLKDVADNKDNFIWVAVSKLHSSIVVGTKISNTDAEGKVSYQVPITGGNLGKKFPVKSDTDVYDYKEESGAGYVLVPDGWVDGNGMYRGVGYMVAEDVPMAQKLVLKVNYASSQQSHLGGCTRLYNDLHTALVGKNTLQSATFADGSKNNSRVAKYNEPVFFFTQAEGNSNVYYRGGGNFGAGKMDKPTWGYDKSCYPYFCMLEGSDNDYPLTDFRVPFDLTHVIEHVDNSDPLNPEVDGWSYAGKLNWDIDAMDMDKDSEGVKRPSVGTKSKSKEITNIIMEAWNYVYLHSPMIEFYAGTFTDFKQSDAAKVLTKKYWCTQGEDAYHLKRYDYLENEWVDAGLWNEETEMYDVIDLRTDSITQTAYVNSKNQSQFAELNKEFIDAVVKDARPGTDHQGISKYFNVKSLRFHYCFINHFIAGTDNCSKNTYIVLDPGTKLFEFHQDDVDTILATDNNGQNTKPYYIDRMHPYTNDDATTHSNYEGMDNALFNLCEKMWEDTGELKSMMGAIFSTMSSLVDERDELKGYTGTAKTSVLGCMYKYMFSFQNYFPAIAYNEQARIRYEMPAMLGFVSSTAGGRNIPPITQSIGDQLQAELQWVKRRIVYMTSYAVWGPFDTGKSGETGIEDLATSLSIQSDVNPDGSASDYIFDVVPHQYMYPSGAEGQTSKGGLVRVKPGETYRLTVATNNTSTGTNSTGMSINAINYYRSVGNLGDISVSPVKPLEIVGKRLKEFKAVPTKLYTTQSGDRVPAFRPSSITFPAETSVRIEVLNIKGCINVGGSFDASKAIRLKAIDLRGTNIVGCTLPKTATLKEVYYPANFVSLQLENIPYLETVMLEGYQNLTTISIKDCGTDYDSSSLVNQAYRQNASMTSLYINNISWGSKAAKTGITSAVMQWICSVPSVSLTGIINVLGDLTSGIKMKLLNIFGNVDKVDNPLRVTYTNRTITGLSVDGAVRIRKDGDYPYKLKFTPDEANNFSGIKWSISQNEYATINENTGVLTAINIPEESTDQPTATVTATVTLVNGTTTSTNMKVYLYNRIPKVGDFAYADGEFDEILHSAKTVVGWVYKVTQLNDTQYECLVQAASNLTLKTSDGSKTYSDLPWGIYENASHTPSTFVSEIASALGLSSSQVTDIASVANVGSSGLYNSDHSAQTYNYVKEYNAYNDSNPDGFENMIGAAADWNGKNKTSAIVAHAKRVISEYALYNIMVGEQTLVEKLEWKDKSEPETLNDLADLIAALKEANLSNNLQQLAYPAAWASALYEPEASGLDEQYKKGSWYLPAEGELVRQYIFFRNSRNYTPADSGDVYAKYHDFNNPDRNGGEIENTPAKRPWYANIAKRAADAGKSCPIAMPSQSYHWSSTENGASNAWYVYFGSGLVGNGGKNGSLVVRPSAAFTFNL